MRRLVLFLVLATTGCETGPTRFPGEPPDDPRAYRMPHYNAPVYRDWYDNHSNTRHYR